MKYLLIFLVILSAEVFAVVPAEEGTITQLLVHRHPTITEDSGRRYIVKLSGAMTDGPCEVSSSWVGYFSDELGRAHYATLLAAAMSNRPVYIEGTDGFCENNGALIRNIYIVY